MKKLFAFSFLISLNISAFAATKLEDCTTDQTNDKVLPIVRSYHNYLAEFKNILESPKTYNKNLQVTSNFALKTTSVLGSYDSITVNYLSGDDKAAAKKFSSEYVDAVLKKAYTVSYVTDKNADNQEIKYTLEDESGVATTLVTYQFREKDFTIKLKSIIYYHKGNKTNTEINKESSTEATSKFYNLIKDYFIDKHANYIAPGGA